MEGHSHLERASVSVPQAAAEAGARSSVMFEFRSSAQDRMWVWILGEGPKRGKKSQTLRYQYIFKEKICKLLVKLTPQF